MYAAVIYPRFDEDRHLGARKITYHLGACSIDNKAIACQVWFNLLVWLSYIAVSSWIAPEEFCLLVRLGLGADGMGVSDGISVDGAPT